MENEKQIIYRLMCAQLQLGFSHSLSHILKIQEIVNFLSLKEVTMRGVIKERRLDHRSH